MDEAANVQYFVDRIRPQTNLEIILAVAYNNESLKNDASSFVKFVESELVRTKMRRESHNYGNKRKMSKFQTRNSGGKCSGKFNGRNHNNNNHKGQRVSNKSGIKVGGMRISEDNNV